MSFKSRQNGLPRWTPNASYAAGTDVLVGDAAFKCLRTHRSGASFIANAADWTCWTPGVELVHQDAHGLSQGDVIAYVDGTYELAIANSFDTCSNPPRIVLMANANWFLYASGPFTASIPGHGLAPGELYYLSPTVPGALTTVEPSDPSHFSNPILRPLDANEVEIGAYDARPVSSGGSGSGGDADTVAGGYSPTVEASTGKKLATLGVDGKVPSAALPENGTASFVSGATAKTWRKSLYCNEFSITDACFDDSAFGELWAIAKPDYGTGYLLSSADCGTSWTLRYASTQLYSAERIFIIGDHVFAVSCGRVFKFSKASMTYVSTAYVASLDYFTSIQNVAVNGSGFVIVVGNTGSGLFLAAYSSDECATWDVVSTGVSDTYVLGCTWSAEAAKFFACGSYMSSVTPFVARSSNGVDWDYAQPPQMTDGTYPTGVAWSDDDDVLGVVDSTGYFYSSSDGGVSWAKTGFTGLSQVVELLWTRDTGFIAIGGDSNGVGSVASSPDGVLWNVFSPSIIKTNGGAASKPRGIVAVCGNTVFGENGTITRRGEFFPLSIVGNGKHANVKSARLRRQFSDVAWMEATRSFVASVSWSNASAASGDTPIGLLVSKDGGVSWESMSTYVYARGFAFSNNVIVVVGGDSQTLYSAISSAPISGGEISGFTWRNTDSGTTYVGVCWSQELGLFCAAGGAGVSTSPDGTVWTRRTDGFFDVLSGIASGNGKLCAIAYGRSYVSSDGVSWTRSDEIANFTCERVIWMEHIGAFCACGGTTVGRVFVSQDGVNWTQVANTQDAANIHAIVWIPELESYYGAAGKSVIISKDLVSWKRISPTSDGDRMFLGIAWATTIATMCIVGLTLYGNDDSILIS